jgi:hypothetical protein
MAVEARNVVFAPGTLCQKRYGSEAQTISGTYTGFASMVKFIPGQSDVAAELHFLSQDATTKWMRVAAGTAASALTLADAIASLPSSASWAVGNGKLYVAYDSTVNRLHVYDPSISTSVTRRVGLPAPGVPTVANTGAGSYGATARYYRVQWATKVSSDIRVLSNLGTISTVFTPSGSGTHARITRPTAASEHETHWRVWGSADGVLFYLISTADIAIATTTYDDAIDPADYADEEAAPEEGAFTPPPSAKYVLWDGNRLLMFGRWETAAGDSVTPVDGRVWFSPVLDTTDADDDERVSNSLSFKGWIDVNRNGGSTDRGLAGPMDGQVFVGQSRGIHMLIPTGDAQIPFRRITLTTRLGWVSQQSTFVGEDESGRACVYFLDPKRGPYRYGPRGFEWLGYDVQDQWALVNQTATVVAHGVYDGEAREVKWWISTSGGAGIVRLRFNVRLGVSTVATGVRKGWTVDDVPANQCSVMFPETFGASMSIEEKPYQGGASTLLRCDDESSTDDAGTAFQSYITSPAWPLDPLHVNKTVERCYLQAAASNETQIQQTLTPNYCANDARVSSVVLTAKNGETRGLFRFDSPSPPIHLADIFTFQTTLGDAIAQARAWTLDEWTATVETTPQERE